MIGQSGGLEPTRDSNPVGLEEHLRGTSAPLCGTHPGTPHQHRTSASGTHNIECLDGEKNSCIALAKSGLAHQHARQTNQFKSATKQIRSKPSAHQLQCLTLHIRLPKT